MDEPTPTPEVSIDPISERLAALEIEVGKLTTVEEFAAQAQTSAWTKDVYSLTNEGRARLLAVMKEARVALRA